ncbi:hypothetical protein AVEN_113830-1 [Araneus ventricosus]|uniref:Uncharacterized protein n=1 Tax=Araneus ventricosus TaxID=182803 RepID=A0A4Y2KWG0_ARAVE|nr:hypothetical protein AVEN_113830-1 [Araneus ventricosus]
MGFGIRDSVDFLQNTGGFAACGLLLLSPVRIKKMCTLEPNNSSRSSFSFQSHCLKLDICLVVGKAITQMQTDLLHVNIFSMDDLFGTDSHFKPWSDEEDISESSTPPLRQWKFLHDLEGFESTNKLGDF